MLETMYRAPGIGLAAPQVAVTKRVIVVDLAREGEEPRPMRIINPEIAWRSEETEVAEEGCLSLPELYAEVRRPRAVRMRYMDERGEEQEVEAEGLLRPLPAARDRPSGRHPLRRSPLDAEAQHDHAQARQGAARPRLRTLH